MLPTGTVTFLFSDIQGSTLLLQKLGDGYARVLGEHQKLLREAFARHAGTVVDTQGDSFFVAFPRALDAVNAAGDAQRALSRHNWGASADVRVRMGIHTGEPTLTGERYVGIDVHRAARIGSAGHGGQVLVSETTRALVQNDLPAHLTLRDLGEHRLKDLRTPKHLYQLVIADLPADFPPLKTLDATPNNLPVQLTNFIGREREIETVKRMLASARLITLTGSGGSGKTRLSLQVAGEVLEQFRDGVWLVELAPLNEPELVAQTIASVLGVREQAGEPILTTLTNYLRDKRLLLILDNCEHLIGACAKMADHLLRACPQLRILASSREALGIAGEMPHRVPSLSLPDPRHLTLDTLTQYEAVRLFIDRVVAWQPTFEVNNRNAPAVAQICARLDGIPLALELAAARIQVLSPEQIARKLDDRFRLLTGGSRTALPRQQTLRAAIDWSYDLLTPPERALLCRLSVFAGGWTLEAAEAVCADETLDPGDILDLLTRLVAKSLVVAQEVLGESRYHMLETVRQYAASRLIALGKESSIRARHLHYFVAWGQVADRKIKSAERPLWTKKIESEIENLRAALEWAIETDDSQGMMLAASLHRFWLVRGYFAEGRAWLTRLLDKDNGPNPRVTCQVLNALSSVQTWEGDLDVARAQLERCIALATQHGYTLEHAYALQWLAIGTLFRGDVEAAEAFISGSVALFRQTGALWHLAESLGWHAWLSVLQQNYPAARTSAEASQALCLRTGDRWTGALGLYGLGQLALRTGDLAQAERLCQESLLLMEQAEDTIGASILANVLGEIARLQGSLDLAWSYYQKSLDLSAESSHRKRMVYPNLGFIRLRQGRPDEAAHLFSVGLYYAGPVEDPADLGSTLFGFAGVALAASAPERAAKLLGKVADLIHSPERQLSPSDLAEYRRITLETRAALGEEFERHFELGRALTIEQVIELATR